MWEEEDWRGESVFRRLFRSKLAFMGLAVVILAGHRIYHFFRGMNRRLMTLEAILLDTKTPPANQN